MLEDKNCENFFKEYKQLNHLGQFKSEMLVFHVANERKASIKYHAKLARMGVVSGIPDYVVHNYSTGEFAYIEFKRDKKTLKLSPTQQEIFEACRYYNRPYLLTYQPGEAIDFLKSL